METETELKEYKVQRKFIGWEETTVEAKSFEEAVQIAEDKDSWYDARGGFEATEDYWVEDTETEETRTLVDGNDWRKN